MNALMKAARDGDLKALKKALKDPKINPNFQDDKTGMTALHTAVVWRNNACTQELLNDNRVKSDQMDFGGRRPIDLASGRILPSLLRATYKSVLSIKIKNKTISGR